MHSLNKFELILVDVQAELCEAWQQAFSTLPRISIHHGLFQDVAEFDCMVSPANSFGIMDGGIDLIIRNYFGFELQENVRKNIEEIYFGEQPVGTSIIVETGNPKHPFLAHTPTMRIPKDISNTDNVYNATFAMLRAVASHNQTHRLPINKVLCPGLGTATGRVKPKEAARQMALAYRNFLHPPQVLIWSDLKARDAEICQFDNN